MFINLSKHEGDFSYENDLRGRDEKKYIDIYEVLWVINTLRQKNCFELYNISWVFKEVTEVKSISRRLQLKS